MPVLPRVTGLEKKWGRGLELLGVCVAGAVHPKETAEEVRRTRRPKETRVNSMYSERSEEYMLLLLAATAFASCWPTRAASRHRLRAFGARLLQSCSSGWGAPHCDENRHRGDTPCEMFGMREMHNI